MGGIWRGDVSPKIIFRPLKTNPYHYYHPPPSHSQPQLPHYSPDLIGDRRRPRSRSVRLVPPLYLARPWPFVVASMLLSLASRAARSTLRNSAARATPRHGCGHGHHPLLTMSRAASSGGDATVVRVKDLAFAHGSHELLSGVDFSIGEGSKVTIMGQNGYDPSTARARFNDGARSQR